MIFQTETEFQEWCNGVLTKLGVHYYHISSKNKFVRRGIFDLTCFWKKRSFCIELKVGKNKLSKDQKIEKTNLDRQCINNYVVWTPDEFLTVLKKELIIN